MLSRVVSLLMLPWGCLVVPNGLIHNHVVLCILLLRGPGDGATGYRAKGWTTNDGGPLGVAIIDDGCPYVPNTDKEDIKHAGVIVVIFVRLGRASGPAS